MHVTRPGYLNVAAHYTLVVDNLLDLSHINYTHAGILGNADAVKAEVEITQDGDVVTASRNSTDTETPGILKMMAPGLERGNLWNSISWFPPSNLLLQFGISEDGQERDDGTGYYAIHRANAGDRALDALSLHGITLQCCGPATKRTGRCATSFTRCAPLRSPIRTSR